MDEIANRRWLLICMSMCFVLLLCVQVTQILHYWMRLLNDGTAGEDKTAAAILTVLQQRNALKTDEVILSTPGYSKGIQCMHATNNMQHK